MNKRKIVEAQLVLYDSVRESTESFVRNYLADMSQPWEDRWEIFRKNCCRMQLKMPKQKEENNELQTHL